MISFAKMFVYKNCFCCLTKELFVSPTSSSLVGILITIDDLTYIFAISFYKYPQNLTKVEEDPKCTLSLTGTTYSHVFHRTLNCRSGLSEN